MDNLFGTIIIQSLLFAAGLFKIYTDMQIKMKELDVRLTSVEKQDDEIYDKLDKISEDLHEIKIELQNKQNRSL